MTENQPSRSASLFDLRTVIAVLFGLFGVILTIVGLVGETPEGLEKAGGIALNLWTGIGMLVLAALFTAWLLARPAISGDGGGRPDGG